MVAPLGVAPIDAFAPALVPLAATPAAGPVETRAFDIGLAPTDGVQPALAPILVPELTTEVQSPGPAPGPVDAGTGLTTDVGLGDPTLDDTAPTEAATIDSESNGVLRLSTVLSTLAAVAAAVCLMA